MKKNMIEEKFSRKVKLKNKDGTRNNFIEEITQNELMNKKHKKLCAALNYIWL